MPFLPETRQYRSFAASNFQPITEPLPEVEDGAEVRTAEPTYKVRGHFCTFSDEYELFPRMGNWPAEYEQIDPHAFDNCNMTDVIMQYDHAGPVMARIKNGSLRIGFDEIGGWAEADLSGCQQARDLYEAITNGLVTEMSFGFMIADDDEGRGTTTLRDEQGDYHTTITRIARLYDCSAVSIPANPNTDISEMRKRSYLAATIEADRKAAEEAAAEAAEQERLAQEAAEAEERAAQEAAEQEATAKAMAMLQLRARAMGLTD